MSYSDTCILDFSITISLIHSIAGGDGDASMGRGFAFKDLTTHGDEQYMETLFFFFFGSFIHISRLGIVLSWADHLRYCQLRYGNMMG